LDYSKIKELKKNIEVLDAHPEIIIDIWMQNSEVKSVLLKHDIEINMFSIEYAHPVLDYFIGIVKGIDTIGQCPVISRFLVFLKGKELSASEIFTICINFRKATIKVLFQKDAMSEEMYENISYIFDANFRGVLEAFSETISAAEAKTKKLYDISTKDHLTKIFNRRKFDEIFLEEIQEANTLNNQFALILLDIDHFKIVNDTYGHEIGDNVLVSLAFLIKLYIRNSDIFARWGGEEFVILMPKANKYDALIKAESIKRAIGTQHFKNVKHITCSFGIADYELGDTQGSMFKRTDDALYTSKETGRNKITVG